MNRKPPLRTKSFEEAKKDYKPLKRSSIQRKPVKPKKKKKLSVRSLKKKAWKEFSIFIRTRGADENGIQECFTCPLRAHWKTLEAGHLVPGRNNSTLFSEIGVNPQCRRCNGHFRGNVIVYYPKMVRLHGQEVVDQLIAARDTTHKWLPNELVDVYSKYKALNDANPLCTK